MIDEDLKVWLIEINRCPGLDAHNEYKKQIIPKMIDEFFQIILDPLFPPNLKYETIVKE